MPKNAIKLDSRRCGYRRLIEVALNRYYIHLCIITLMRRMHVLYDDSRKKNDTPSPPSPLIYSAFITRQINQDEPARRYDKYNHIVLQNTVFSVFRTINIIIIMRGINNRIL